MGLRTGLDQARVVPQRPPVGRATYQDVLDAPPGMVAELIDGVLHLQPRPVVGHARVATALGALLWNAFQAGRGGLGGWEILDEPEVHLGPQVLVPDIAGWRLDRATVDLEAAFATTPPAWVCEVLSPSTARKDRDLKLPRYGEHGVLHAWLVDPGARRVEVYARVDDRRSLVTTHAGAGPARLPPFEAVALPMGDVWPPARGER